MNHIELLKARQRIGNILFHKRCRKDIPKSYFAIVSGLGRDTIDFIETGKKDYTVDSLFIYRYALKFMYNDERVHLIHSCKIEMPEHYLYEQRCVQGQNLYWCRQRKMNRAKFGEHTGLTLPTIINIESGLNNYRVDCLIMYKNALREINKNIE